LSHKNAKPAVKFTASRPA